MAWTAPATMCGKRVFHRCMFHRAKTCLLLVTGDGGASSRRLASTAQSSAKPSDHEHKAKVVGRKMKSWQIHQYGGTEQLRLSTTTRVPPLEHPNDVLVAVHAARGYGANTFNTIRCFQKEVRKSEFPLTLGRDFSGVVVETGREVSSKSFSPGDEVWGTGMPIRQGTHSEYCVLSAKEIGKKPDQLSHIEAASLPYVICTTWAAACTSARIKPGKLRGKRVLILGGSGGLGTFAIQLLKAWGAEVTCTCSESAIPLVLECGADVAMDYTQTNANKELENIGGFDFVLDCVSWSPDQGLNLLKKRSDASYVSLVNPLLSNNSKYGLLLGFTRSAVELGTRYVQGASDGRRVIWGFFQPSQRALNTVAKLVEQEKVRVIVDAVFPFEEMTEAYQKVAGRHGRGKTVVDMSHLHS